MEQKYLDQAAGYENLGPHYFAAREAAEKFMEAYKPEDFKPLIQKAADEFMERMQSNLEDWFLSNVEANLQNTMWHQIDGSVEALLSGQQWALDRYLLGTRYDHGKIREAVAKLVPAELQDARVKDLEEENKQLRERVETLQRYR